MSPLPTELPRIDEVYLSAWTTAWIADTIMIAASAGYLILLRRRARAGLPWRGRLIAWAGAMAALVVACNSSVSVYSDTLFWAHMIQHLLLIMVVPPLLVWAEVFSLIPAGGRQTFADVLDRSPIWRRLTSPLVSVPLYGGTVVLTHLTAFQQFAVMNPHVRTFENSLYLVAGYLLFAELVRKAGGTHHLPDLVRIATIIAAMGADTLAGLGLMLTAHPLAPAYAASHPGWGPNALTDQKIAGALMWVFGDVLMMILMTVIGVLWGLRKDDSGVGEWLETIRRRQVLGENAAAFAQDPTIDLDQAALDAYNARLAALSRLDSGDARPAGAAEQDGSRL